MVLGADNQCGCSRFMERNHRAQVVGVPGGDHRLDLLLMMPLIQGYVFLFLRNETFSAYDPRNWWTLMGSTSQTMTGGSC